MPIPDENKDNPVPKNMGPVSKNTGPVSENIGDDKIKEVSEILSIEIPGTIIS